jgi:outer membrane protein
MAAVAPAVSAQQVIAFVDVQDVMLNSARGLEVQEQLKSEFAAPIGEMRKQEEALTKLGTQIASQSATLSAEALENLRRQYEDMQLQLQRSSQDIEREVQKRQTELFNDLEINIIKAVDAIRIEKGIGIVLAKQNSGIIAADANLDITADVMTRMNTAP